MASLSRSETSQLMEQASIFLEEQSKPDGGFGWSSVDHSDAWTTAECAIALISAGHHPSGQQALKWLRSNVENDGGWKSEAYRYAAGEGSDVAATTYAIRALASCGEPSDRLLIERGCDWLLKRQRDDGGWGIAFVGEPRSHIGNTGYAISALSWAPTSHRAAEGLQEALYFLASNQRSTGGWGIAPGRFMDATLTGYAMRGLIDAARLRGVNIQVTTLIDWLANVRAAQNSNGSWPDWYGNVSSPESTGYCIEIAASANVIKLSDVNLDPTFKSALQFLADTVNSDGGWGTAPGDESGAWVTHSIVVSLSKLLGMNDDICLSLPEESFPPSTRATQSPKTGEYDFALSFAGTDRRFAEALALRLQYRGASVFYDNFEAAELWGANLVEKLSDVYRDRARFCLMLISEDYIKRAWPKLERQSAQARSLMSDDDYILPIKLDSEVKVPGLLETVGFVDADQYDVDSIAALAMRKLGKN